MDRSLFERNCALLQIPTSEVAPQSSIKHISKAHISTLSISPPRDTTRQQPFKPTISRKSLQLASRLGKSKFRLLPKQQKDSILQQDLTDSPSFHPTINKRSALLVTRIRKQSEDHSKFGVWEALYSGNQSVCDRSYRLQELEQQEEHKQCTFRPNINRSESVKGNVIQRLNQWAKNRAENLRLAVENASGKGLEECTFMPITLDIKTSPKSKPALSNGVDKFLERQRRARLRKNGQEEPCFRSKSAIEQNEKVEPPTLLNTKQFPGPIEQEISGTEYAEAQVLLHSKLSALDL